MTSNDKINVIPKKSTSDNILIIKFDDIKFSCCEYSEGPVGLTYIDFGKTRAKVYMDIRGGWPAYTNALSTNDKNMIDGICIAGGSMLGLEATSGIIAESLKESKYKTWKGINGSIIYSKNLRKNKIYPDKELGRFAYNNLSNKLYYGQVGAGLSASKGQGVSFHEFKNGIKVLSILVNNALGDVYKNNKKINKYSEDLENTEMGTKTTITVLITNLEMDDHELKQMSHQVNCSIAEVIRPFNTFFDGDIFYSCSTCTLEKPKNFNSKMMINFYLACSEIVKDSVYKSLA